MNKIYTIGHSNHSIDYFYELLKAFEINCLIDVRSFPYSKYASQFNKESLQNFLKSHRIEYLHFGKEFGARKSEPDLLDVMGQVDFKKVQETQDFKAGVERLREKITGGSVIALMCTEAEPLDCHRFSMISSYLEQNDFSVFHILKDKTLISQVELEEMVIKKSQPESIQLDFFGETIIQRDPKSAAYEQLNKKIGFRPTSN